jgi:hypothetical protein
MKTKLNDTSRMSEAWLALADEQAGPPESCVPLNLA